MKSYIFELKKFCVKSTLTVVASSDDEAHCLVDEFVTDGNIQVRLLYCLE